MAWDKISLSVTPVLRFDGKKGLSQGTGFFMAHPAEGGGFVLSLVTNYHVIAGSAPKRHIEPKGDRIQFELRTAGKDVTKVKRFVFPLRTRDGSPTWTTSQRFPNSDVAVVPLPLGDGLFAEAPTCFDSSDVSMDIASYPGQTVSVVGYPMGWRDLTSKAPVWKTGNLASEPEEDFNGEPRFLIDITGRKGMSGAPVVAGHKELHFTGNGLPRMGASGRLLGVYASNALQTTTEGSSVEELSIEEAAEDQRHDIDLRPELGFVWKASVVMDILESLRARPLQKEVWARLPNME